jgi:peptidyl-tRNA hydrolase, PTH1 family
VWVFAGLGNPGRQFLFNRHNVGFMVIDYACTKLNIERSLHAHKTLIMYTHIEQNEIMIVKPLTYMNSSGEALKQLTASYDIPLKDLVVIYDDLYLPLGAIKIKSRGNSGGHNGMTSIISSLGTTEIPRIKAGIQQETPVPADVYADYVLSDFEESELPLVHEMVEKAYDAMVCISSQGLHTSMNTFNKR